MKKLEKNKKKKSRTDREQDFLEVLRKLDSVAHQRTRKKQKNMIKNGKLIKDFNKAESELFSKVYISSLKAKLSLLAKQLKEE